jgi:anti-sigma regulatory factor (Ser/Thr protein kinase)
MQGYVTRAMATTTTSELRIPADPQYIVVAKRAASAFASVAGFGVEAVDELSIAIAQACENAIGLATCVMGSGRGQVRILFKVEQEGKLDVDVRTVFGRAEEGAAEVQRAQVEVTRRGAGAARSTTQVTDRDALKRQLASADMALRLMGLFVDDCFYRVDQRTGGLRVRLTKYRVSS